MLGMLFGSMFFGLISDQFGRMPALMLAISCVSLSGLLGAFMPTAAGYGFFRWLTGIGGMGSFMITFVIAVEYVGFKYTMLLGILIEVLILTLPSVHFGHDTFALPLICKF